MAGRFIKGKYEDDNGVVRNIRIQPETVFEENLEPVGGVSERGYVRVTGSRRAYGRKARSVTLSRSVGDDTDYNGATVYARIPVLKKSSIEQLTEGTAVVYQDVAWVVVGHSPESSR